MKSKTPKTSTKKSTSQKTEEINTSESSAPKLDFNINLDDINIDDIEISEDDMLSYLETDKTKAELTPDALDFNMEVRVADNATENNFIQMAKFKTLSKEEEFDLAKRIEVGLYASHLLEIGKVSEKDLQDYEWLIEDGKRAKTIFTNTNRKLISATIKKMGNTGSAKHADYNTMTIYGQMGVDIAINKYDYKTGYRFSTIAVMRIQATIDRELTKNNKLVKTPQHIIEKIRKMRRVSMDFESKFGRTPTPEETAQIMGIKVDDVKLLLDAEVTEKSIYDNMGDTEGSLYIDSVEDENLEGIFDSEMKKEDNIKLHEVLEKIATKDEKAKDAFSFYYGFDSEIGRVESKAEIGKILGVGEQQVDNLIHRAEAKVCHPAFGLLTDFTNSSPHNLKI